MNKNYNNLKHSKVKEYHKDQKLHHSKGIQK